MIGEVFPNDLDDMVSLDYNRTFAWAAKVFSGWPGSKELLK